MAGALQQSTRRGLSPWSGFGPLSPLRDDMEDLLERFTGDGDDWPSQMLAPPTDLSETDGALQVRLDLPGVDPKEIDIQVSGSQLTIAGERKEEKEEKGKTFHRIERRSGRFSRSVTLPCAVEEEKIIEHLGQQVACGHCGSCFVASDPTTSAQVAPSVLKKANQLLLRCSSGRSP